MSEKIDWSLNVSVADGPTVAASSKVEVEAYQKIQAVVSAASSKTIKVQPQNGAQFLLITVTEGYDTPLAYEVDGSGTQVLLDGPHFLIGSGAVKLLGNTQEKIKFTNGHGSDMTVNILVGRKAT